MPCTIKKPPSEDLGTRFSSGLVVISMFIVVVLATFFFLTVWKLVSENSFIVWHTWWQDAPGWQKQKNKCSCESVGCSTYWTGHCKSAVQLVHLVTPWLNMKPAGIQMSSPQRAEIWILSSLPQISAVYSLFVRFTNLATEGASSLIFDIYHKRSQTHV